MGVAGCGKTSVGEALAVRLGWTFIDGDILHPPENIAKMKAGAPLNDTDRKPWLKGVGQTLRDHPGKVAVGCSALKRKYRELIKEVAGEAVSFVFLDGPRELIEQRMAARCGHFMPLSLLDSQFATLERPLPQESAFTINISRDLDSIINLIMQELEDGKR